MAPGLLQLLLQGIITQCPTKVVHPPSEILHPLPLCLIIDWQFCFLKLGSGSEEECSANIHGKHGKHHIIYEYNVTTY